MNSDNFNKLFAEDFGKAQYTDLKKLSTSKRQQLTDEDTPKSEKLQIIEEANEPIPQDVSRNIQLFIEDQKRQGKKLRQIRRMVKRKFGIMVV